MRSLIVSSLTASLLISVGAQAAACHLKPQEVVVKFMTHTNGMF